MISSQSGNLYSVLTYFAVHFYMPVTKISYGVIELVQWVLLWKAVIKNPNVLSASLCVYENVCVYIHRCTGVRIFIYVCTHTYANI